ncbi:MAG: ABC transporter permease, partial [Cytophaga sp.]
MESKDVHSPSFYIKKRLFSNKPAMFGLGLIILAHIIAILGYSIMPDNTPNADDGANLIKKQPPGFKTQLIKKHKSIDVEEVNFFTMMFNGRESAYTIEPVDTFYLKGDSVYYKEFNERLWESGLTLSYIDAFYSGTSKKLFKDSAAVYKITTDSAYYVDTKENVH